LGLARRLRDDEIANSEFTDAAGQPLDPTAIAAILYALVSSNEGQIRLLPKTACIQSVPSRLELDNEPVFAADTAQFLTVMTDQGMKAVQLFRPENTVPGETPRYKLVSPSPRPDYDPLIPDSFPAHVFKPVGAMDVPSALQARFVLNVGPAPDADPGKRFTKLPDPAANDPGVVVLPIRVELYPATGRVRIAS
jgi:hypothetical protein